MVADSVAGVDTTVGGTMMTTDTVAPHPERGAAFTGLAAMWIRTGRF
jgi:hypothetical protein